MKAFFFGGGGELKLQVNHTAMISIDVCIVGSNKAGQISHAVIRHLSYEKQCIEHL